MFRYELHMHSREGSACGQSSIEDMISSYHRLGFAGAAVTNHFLGGNTAIDRTLPWEALIEAYSLAYTRGKEFAKTLDFDLLFGIEQGYGKGKEFLAYGFEPSFLTERPFLRDAELSVWAREIHAVGGYLGFAHPFRVRPYITDPDEMPDMTLADGFEGYNMFNSPEENERAVKLLSAPGKVCTAGSDLHTCSFNRAFGVVFPERVTSSEALAKRLKSGNFSLFLGK
ncbi:MAG: hypothetical protein EGP89_02765 [Ruminococcaceae bacterium]|nr:hypothetical protein [Oscillospiraceae bacterium]